MYVRTRVKNCRIVDISVNKIIISNFDRIKFQNDDSEKSTMRKKANWSTFGYLAHDTGICVGTDH